MPITSIGVRNYSTTSDVEVMRWAAATRKQIERDVRQFWDIPVPTFHLIPTDTDPGGTSDIDSWVYVVNDAVDVDGQRYGLGWHKTIDFWPIAYVLTDFTRNQNPPQTPSRVFSHEVLEMAVDPDMTATTPAINGTEYLVEVGDVLAYDGGGYLIDEVLVSGFGTPAYFHGDGGAVFSFRGPNNPDPIGGPLPAKAPKNMGTVLCWLEGGTVRSVLLDAALPAGAFPDPAKSTEPPHRGTRRARRTLPEDAIGWVVPRA